MAEIITIQDAQYAMDLVKTICTEVGPGLPGSAQERARAEIFKKELASHLGAENVVVEDFTLAPGGFLSIYPGLFTLIAALLNISMGRIMGISPWLTSIAALAFSISALLVFVGQFMLGLELIDPLLKKEKSENVIGALRKPGAKTVSRVLILSGHHDSAPENMLLVLLNYVNRLLNRRSDGDSARQNAQLRTLGTLFYIVSVTFLIGLITMVVMSAIQLAGVITGSGDIVRIGTLGWVLMVFPIVPTILYGFFCIKAGKNGGNVPGAVDNLSASALVAAMSRFLVNNSEYIPDETEIRFISFGSEEAGLRGSRRYVARHLGELKSLEARLLNYEMVAHPEIGILTAETNGFVKNAPEMVKSVVAAAEHAGVPYRLQPPTIGVGTDAASFSRAGLMATALLPFKSPEQLVACYHQRSDGPENLTIEPLLNVLKLTFEWVRNGGGKA